MRGSKILAMVWALNSMLTSLDVAAAPISATTTTTTTIKLAPVVKLIPFISKVEYSGVCVYGDALLTLRGENFGTSSSGKRIGFKGLKNHVHTTATSWSATRITLRVPGGTSLISGQKYYLGIETTTERWLSNVTQYVTVCMKIKSLNPVVSSSSSTSDEIVTPIPPLEGVGDDVMMDEFPAGGWRRQISSSNFLDSQLPPPPEELPPLPPKRDKTIDPGEIVVVNTSMAKAMRLAKKLRGMGLRVKRRRNLKSLGMVVSVFRVPADASVGDTLKRLRKAAPKTWADTNARYKLQGTSSKRYAKKLIGWQTGKRTRQCGKGIRLGMIDTGIDKSHPSLRNKKITVRSFLTPGIKAAGFEHGTATASILVGNSQLALSGLVPRAKLFVANVFRQRGAQEVDTTVEWLVMAMDWLASQRVQIINLGLGGQRNLLVEAAIRRLQSRGIAVVAAAGNGGPQAMPVYPAAQKGVIAVTAVDAQLGAYRKANRGKYISFAAPGVDIWVAKAGGKGMYVSGTSYAAPYVTASLVAGRKEVNKPWKSVLKRLIKRTRDLGRPGKDPVFGWGLVQTKGKCVK